MIPTSGNITSAVVQSEWGFSVPFTSEQVRVAAGLALPWTSEQLRGKSAIDVTPNALNWHDIELWWESYGGMASTPNYLSTQMLTIAGLTPATPITLRLELSDMPGTASLHFWMRKNGTQTNLFYINKNATAVTWQSQRFTVVNGDTVQFWAAVAGGEAFWWNSPDEHQRFVTVRIYNETDGNKLIDTIQLNMTHRDFYYDEWGGGGGGGDRPIIAP